MNLKKQCVKQLFEKGDKPLEIVTSRQWYIRNGGKNFTQKDKTKPLNKQLLDQGKLKFHPDFMRVRYENWINGLNSDWLISRQRFLVYLFLYGMRLIKNGDIMKNYHASLEQLPVDPSIDVPEGYTQDQRNCPNGFAGEVDIMDTWATSSLTPLIVSGYMNDEDLFKRGLSYGSSPSRSRHYSHMVIYHPFTLTS